MRRSESEAALRAELRILIRLLRRKAREDRRHGRGARQAHIATLYRGLAESAAEAADMIERLLRASR